jgi:hypothetical protein
MVEALHNNHHLCMFFDSLIAAHDEGEYKNNTPKIF